MPIERPSAESEFLDVSSLDAPTKMRYILEIFDLGKDKEKNEKRKKDFTKLLSNYNSAYIKSEITPNFQTKQKREKYEAGRANLHNEIMDILRNMSLSMGLSTNQMAIVSYLAQDRDEVTRMIASYFSVSERVTINTPSEYLKTKEQLDYLSGKTGPEEE